MTAKPVALDHRPAPYDFVPVVTSRRAHRVAAIFSSAAFMQELELDGTTTCRRKKRPVEINKNCRGSHAIRVMDTAHTGKSESSFSIQKTATRSSRTLSYNTGDNEDLLVVAGGCSQVADHGFVIALLLTFASAKLLPT